MLAIPFVVAMTPSAAWADKIGGVYSWDCGSSRSGGVFIEDWGKTITVVINDESGRHKYVFHNHVAKHIGGGSKGTAQDFVSNDGTFGSRSHGYCEQHP